MGPAALCDECGAPLAPAAARCPRCGASLTAPVKPARPAAGAARAERAWALSSRATAAFALAGQLTQWLSIAHHGATAWSLARAALTLAVGAFVWRRLRARSEATLVVWPWVMNASAAVMALTFLATERWMPLRGFDLWLTAWAWATVVVYAAVLWGLRRVVLAGAVG
jgi:hypothetical protein